MNICVTFFPWGISETLITALFYYIGYKKINIQRWLDVSNTVMNNLSLQGSVTDPQTIYRLTSSETTTVKSEIGLGFFCLFV